MDRKDFLKGTLATGAAALAGSTLLNTPLMARGKKIDPKRMKYFMDTHDKNHKTFPDKITPEQLEGFYAKYEQACYEEGVIPVRLHVGYQDGKAFCLTMAMDVESVKRAHDKVGLPYDIITEVAMATPGDTFLKR